MKSVSAKKILLTKMDKTNIENNLNICTDSHGKNCSNINLKETNKNIN